MLVSRGRYSPLREGPGEPPVRDLLQEASGLAPSRCITDFDSRTSR